MKRIDQNLFVGLTLLLCAPFAQAQLDEVVVTATKRVESIQDVPVSVTFVGADTMEKIGITDVEDLSALIPNFEINSSPVIPNLYIRGLGGGLTHSIEQSVGRFVDGVYIGRSVINLHPFIDVASAEVLRGPQGTLFGKNTAAGALIIRSNQPTQDFESGLNLSYGEYDTTGNVTELNGFVSGGLSDRVSGRVAFLYKDREGFYENLADGPDGAQREDYGVQGILRFDVSDATTISLKGKYMEYEEDGSDVAEMSQLGGPPLFVWQSLWTNSGAPNADLYSAGLDWKVFYNCGDAFATPGNGSVPIGSFCPSRDMESTNVTLDVEHSMSAGTLSLIAAYQDYSYVHGFHALDGGFGNFFRAVRAEDYDGISTELRFTSEASETFDYIAGLYFENSEINRRQDSDRNLTGLGPGVVLEREHEPWSQEIETLAVFGQARWHFSDRVTGILGARWATETKDFNFERFYTPFGTDNGPVIPDITPRSESRDEDKFTPAVTIQFSASDDVNLYASYSQGHKTGGFSDRVDTQDGDIQFDEEVHDSVELGMKGSFFDNAVSLNVALFHIEIEGLQLATLVAGTANQFVVDNAADSTSEGFEVEFNWAVNDNWLVGANYSYTDATYDEFLGLESCNPDLINADGDCDLSGEPLQYAPKNKASVYVDYFASDLLGSWGFGARVDGTYTDDLYTDVSLQNFAFSEAYTMYGASLRLISPSDKITVSLVGRNLGNEKVNAWSAGAGPNSISTMAPPRLLTLKLGMRF